MFKKLFKKKEKKEETPYSRFAEDAGFFNFILITFLIMFLLTIILKFLKVI